jgi:hypothetical protein
MWTVKAGLNKDRPRKSANTNLPVYYIVFYSLMQTNGRAVDTR